MDGASSDFFPANTSVPLSPRDLSQRRLASLVSEKNSAISQRQRTELPYQVCLRASRGLSEQLWSLVHEGIDWLHSKPQRLEGSSSVLGTASEMRTQDMVVNEWG